MVLTMKKGHSLVKPSSFGKSEQHEIITAVNGGVGKMVMFTAVAWEIKKQFPNSKLTVIGPHLEVLKKNKDIDAMFYTNSNELDNFWKNVIEPHMKGKKNIDFGLFAPISIPTTS